MSEPSIEPRARHDIDLAVERALRDAGFREPPVDINVVLKALEVDVDFYDLDDPGLLRSLRHRLLIGTRRLADLVEKVRLRAILLFDDRKVLLDSELPKPKHDWASAHEAGHQIIPWHREFCRGDTVLTLDPAWHEELEAEANHAASGLLFCGRVFARDALDTEPSWQSIQSLRQLHKKSLLSTARRYVLEGPQCAMLLLVSTAPWDEKPADQAGRIRYLVPSPSFDSAFTLPDPEVLRAAVDARAEKRKGGPVGAFELVLLDKNSRAQAFRAESFYNQHYVMTLFVHSGLTRPAFGALYDVSAATR